MSKRLLSIILALCLSVGNICFMQTTVMAAYSTEPMIDAGFNHSVALKSDGTVWAWGHNSYGQLGNGTKTDSSTPVQVIGLSNVKAISAGSLHTVALKNDGTVWTWGLNKYGQLGNDTTTDSVTPVRVNGLSNVKAISAGYWYTIALKNDGTVWAWGYNGDGQLGNGTKTNSLTPVQVTGLSNIKVISAGSHHTIALKNDATVWTWGRNSYGELGNGTKTDSLTPIWINDLTNVKAISAKGGHTVALKNDGSVWTWGLNKYGELGNGTTTNSLTPVRVTGLTNVKAISAGSWHTIALKNDGSVWTWGLNKYGELGNGTKITYSTPVQVTSNVKAISANGWYTVTLKNDGSVWTWGRNEYGQLGNGTTTDSSTPTRVLSDGSIFNTGSITTTSNTTSTKLIDATTSSSDMILAKSNLENSILLNDIEFGKDKISGPYVSVLGKKFNMFELNGKLKIKLSDKTYLQFKVDTKSKTVQALFGFKNISPEEAEVGDNWKTAYNKMKNIYKAFNGSNPSKSDYDNIRKLNSFLKKNDTKFFANIEGNVCGYLEWAYDSGSFDLSEGGLILIAKGSGDIYARIPAIPTSYSTLGLELSSEGKIALKDDKNYNTLSLSTSMKFTPELTAGFGLGARDVHIEGGFKGNLEIKVLALTGYFKDNTANYDPFTLTASGSLYIEGKAGAFKYTHKIPVYGPEQWYPKQAEITAMSADDIDESDFKLISRDYLNNTPITPFSFDPNTSFDKQSLYPYNSPNLAVLDDGTRLLIWTDDDGTKGNADVTSVFYSVYDNDTQTWSEASTLWDNEGYNGDPTVYCDGENVYILWQRVAESLSEDVTLEEHMAKTDLYCLVFDGNDFSQPVLVSNSERNTYENGFEIFGSDGNITVCWTENDQNDLFMTEGNNSLYERKYIDGEWQDEEEIITSSDTITDIKIIESADNTKIAYSLRSLDDETTTLYINNNGNTDYSKTYNTECDVIQVVGDDLYYIDDNEIHIYNITDKTDSETGIGDISNFEVITNGDEKVILTLVSTGFTCEMYGSWYDSAEGTWGNLIQLTDYGKYIRNYSASLKDDGNILMAVNLVDVNDDYTDEDDELYGTAELKVIESSEYNDLVLNYFTYDSKLVAEGGTLPIEFNITNNSLNSIDTVYAKLTDESGNTLADCDISCEVASGESADLTFDCTLPETITKQDITLTISCDYDDSNTDNNSDVTDIGLANVEIENLALETTDSDGTVTAYIKNTGFETAENIVINIYNSNANDTLLKTYNIDSLNAGEETTVVFDLPSTYYRLLDSTTLHALYFDVSTDTTEADYDTNSDKILFGDLRIGMLKGDVNLDGTVDTIDAAAILRYINGVTVPDSYDMGLGDYNNDEVVNIGDVIAILNLNS